MSFGAIGGAVAATVVGSALGGGGGGSEGAPQPVRALPFASQNNLFSTQLDRRGNAVMAARGDINDLQFENLFAAREFQDMARNNRTADLAGQQGFNFLRSLGGFAPEDIMQQQFNILNPLLQREQQRQTLDQEARLFAQGRLGSTGGARDIEALAQGQGDATARLLADSFGLGLQGRQQQANLGIALSQLDPQLRGLFQNVSGAALGNALSIQDAARNQFATIAGAMGAGGQTGAGSPLTTSQAVGAGLVNAGIEGITGAVGGLFQPSASVGGRPTATNAQLMSGPFPGTFGR